MVRFKHAICSRRTALMCLGAALPGAYLASRLVNASRIPFLITADVHDQPNLYNRLSVCLDRLALMDLRITFFVPAKLRTNGVMPLFQRMVAAGHQVACHGLIHSDGEDYYSDPYQVQQRNLTCAKQLLEDVIGMSVTAFRAPEFRISKDTLNVLDELGFAADLSICSQRLPLFSSQIGNYHWLLSPRTPYHPSRMNPYAKGDLKLLEIPTSAALLPLMSVLNSVSVTATKLMTDILWYEAAIVNKPIVYQCHVEDFVFIEQPKRPMRVTWRSLLPTRHGIPVRWVLEETDGKAIYKKNQEFFEFIMHKHAFQFLTVDEFLASS